MSAIEARFVSRPSRFLARAELPDGAVVDAHVPNTARLERLLVADRRVALRPASGDRRRTRFTLTRVWDGTWVSLEANRAADLLAGWIEAGGALPPVGRVRAVEREVTVGTHRLDLRLHPHAGLPVWVEVKSGSRARDGDALLSATPSERGASHLRLLARLAGAGSPAACAFVIQRGDVDRLVVGGDADGGWIEAVRGAQRAGVHVVAYACAVTREDVRVDRRIPVHLTP